MRDGRKLNLPDAWDGWRMPLHDLCNLHPFEWVQRAVDEFAAKDLDNPPRFLAKILLSWKAKGGPPPVPEVRISRIDDDAAAMERERLDCIRAEEEHARRQKAGA